MRLLLLATLLSGCVSTKVALTKDGGQGKPDYTDYLDYYAFGLSDGDTLDLQRICLEKKPEAFEQTRTLEDGLLTFLTLGIYSPLTVRVWCEK